MNECDQVVKARTSTQALISQRYDSPSSDPIILCESLLNGLSGSSSHILKTTSQAEWALEILCKLSPFNTKFGARTHIYRVQPNAVRRRSRIASSTRLRSSEEVSLYARAPLIQTSKCLREVIIGIIRPCATAATFIRIRYCTFFFPHYSTGYTRCPVSHQVPKALAVPHNSAMTSHISVISKEWKWHSGLGSCDIA